MAQHFLLSKEARTLSIAQVMRMSDKQAFEAFKRVRWAETGGQPVCPKCGCTEAYEITTRQIWKCRDKDCRAQYSVTSGTIFASRKLSLRDYLACIALFVNGAKGVSALQISRDLNVNYKVAFVLCHKLREAMGAQQEAIQPGGKGEIVEIDGAYFGGYVKPENYKVNRLDRRLSENQTGKRKAVVVMRERQGRTATAVFKNEAASVDHVAARIADGSIVHADEATVWDELHGHYAMKRVNHSVAFRDEGACTNQAESYFSRLRRAEIGTHHHISGRYLAAYAAEMGWREDMRRESNGAQYYAVMGAAAAHPVSRQWKGYWQRLAR